MNRWGSLYLLTSEPSSFSFTHPSQYRRTICTDILPGLQVNQVTGSLPGHQMNQVTDILTGDEVTDTLHSDQVSY